MKRNLLFTSVLLLKLFVNQAFAQLNGIYTIGNAPSDYQTITEAVNALNSQGISGSVIFDIKPGIYNEQFVINQIAGAQPSKTITFRSQDNDSTSVVIQFPSSSTASNNFVVKFNGADYITFERLTMKRTDTLKYCRVVEISGTAKKNIFRNCIFQGNLNTGNTQIISAIIGTDNTGVKSYTVFENNNFKNGSYGLYFIGQSASVSDTSIILRRNVFTHQTMKAIHMENQRYLYVEKNEITTNTSNNTYNAMYLKSSNDTMRIVKNKISLSTGYGICLWNCNETSTQKSLVANNFISIGGNSNAIGIYIVNSRYQYIFHNNVNIYNTVTIQGSCININGGTTQYLYLKNNVFANAGTGQGYAIYVSGTTGTTPITESDYNDLFVASGQYIGYWRTGNVTTLSNWRTTTSLDMNSFIANPGYVSQTDLHVSAAALNGAGTNVLNGFVIKTDIDDDIRNTTSPDVGADEFHINNLGISAIELPTTGVYCQNTPFNVKVKIKNYSTTAYNASVPVYYKFADEAIISETTPVLNILPGETYTYTFSHTENRDSTGMFRLLAGTALLEDNNYTNDTTSTMVQVLKHPVANFLFAINDLQVTFTNTSENATHYVWSFGDGSNTSNEDNPVHIFPDYGDYNVMLVASNLCSSNTKIQQISLVGMNDFDNSMKSFIKIYPNPANDDIHVFISPEINYLTSIIITDATGRIFRKIENIKNTQDFKINVSDFSQGIYKIIFSFDEESVTKSIFISK